MGDKTLIMDIIVCKEINKYYRERPQLERPELKVLGYELDNKILLFIDSKVREINSLKQRVEELEKDYDAVIKRSCYLIYIDPQKNCEKLKDINYEKEHSCQRPKSPTQE